MSPRLAALRRALLLLALLAGLFATTTAVATAADGGDGTPVGTIDILPLRGSLDPPAVAGIEDLLADAADRGSQLVVLQLDTNGGLAVDAEGLVTAVVTSPTPVVVYAGPAFAESHVAGLGALLLASADVGVAAQDATIGPVLPVDRADDTPAADRQLLAEALSQRDVHGDELATYEDALLTGTVTAEQAQDLELVDFLAGGLDGLLVELDGRQVLVDGRTVTLDLADAEVKLHSLGLIRRALHASTTPIVVYLMLVVGLGLLLFELFQPGFGVAGIAAIVVLLLAVYGVVVLPVTWWAVLLLVVGLGLLAADTAIAGLGVPTAAGTGALIAGSMFLYPSPYLGVPGWLIAATVVAALGFFVVVMTIVLRAQAGPSAEGIDQVVGKVGVVRSALNPEGHVFVDGALWRARWTGPEGKVAVGTRVRAHGTEGAVVLVEPAEAELAADR